MARNVLGTELIPCSMDPITGFYRDGCCNTGGSDVGLHLVCAEMTEEFLAYSQSVGNDLSTPNAMMQFPGLEPGDRWCLCVDRWKQALEAGVAPPVVLEGTHISALEFVTLEKLKAFKAELAADVNLKLDEGKGGAAAGEESVLDENTVLQALVKLLLNALSGAAAGEGVPIAVTSA